MALIETRAEWQPIETAPKDGSWFVGAVIRGDKVLAVTRARWFAKRKLWQDMECDRYEGLALTHWMPEPPLPHAKEDV